MVKFHTVFDYLDFENRCNFEVHNINFEAQNRLKEVAFPLNLNQQYENNVLQN